MLYMTAPDRRTALRIAAALLEARLIACANVWEASSLYRWKGRTLRAREAVAVMKTTDRRVRAAIQEAKRLHPDQVPCIVAYRMTTGHQPYLAWLASETRENALTSRTRRRARP